MSDIFVDVWDVAEKKINREEALDFVADAAHGAGDLFIGAVRNHNLGRKVLGVSYDVHDELAKNCFREICQEAQKQWGPQLKLYVIHSKGRLEIGQLSIVLLLWPLFMLGKRFAAPPLQRWASELSSAALCGLGLYWLIERAFPL